MASSILLLSDQTVNQIAAGEVIEAPASVVKELFENAIDAKASRITVAIKGGGLGLIQVSDNGQGMEENELPLAVLRHTTSKIKAFEDLENLATLGFRGEALASIVSVAKVKVTSSKGEKAVSLFVEGGKITGLEPAARVRGTTIEVRSLFYNVPARQKFQKSPAALTAQIVRSIQNLALAHPQINLKLFIEEKLFWEIKNENEPFEMALKTTMETILGDCRDYRWLSFQENNFALLGYLGEPFIAKRNKLGQHLQINGRPVFSALISQAVKEGYATALGSELFPAFALDLRIPGSFVDVNVHPQKKEVRFKEERLVKEKIKKAVFASLMHLENLTVDGEIFRTEKTALWAVEPALRKEEVFLQNSFLKETEAVPKEPFLPLALIGPYYLVEDLSGLKKRLAVIDLTQALAALLFQEATGFVKKESLATQRLLMPRLVDFSASELLNVENKKTDLAALGFEIRRVGSKTLALDTKPAFLEEALAEEFFLELFEELKSFGKSCLKEAFLEKKWARFWSAFAQKRTRFSEEEARSLALKLFTSRLPQMAPLGEKIILFLDKKALDDLFQRRTC
ncbi:MAG: DNA mismatch repair endonuclease MutL [Parachlamydiales bacterium]|jgi:DNA mismatch repair protein MutL